MRHDAEVEIWANDGLYTYKGDIVVSGSDISVSYDVDDDQIAYKGTEVERGHYRLFCNDPEIDGEATLHGFSGSKMLEGFWREKTSGSGTGMWRVKLLDAKRRNLPARSLAIGVFAVFRLFVDLNAAV